MATRVSLETLPDGRVAVVKVALTGDRQDRSAEATWLAEARHRGVVQLLGIDDNPVTLKTLHAGGTTLRTGKPKPAVAAFLLADAAITLADLHERGFVHGQLTLDHLVICDTRIALCSPSGTETEPGADLAGLATCIETLIERWITDGVEVPDLGAWQRLCIKLRSNEESYSARRAARELAKIGSKTESGGRTEKSDDNRSSNHHRLTTHPVARPLGLLLGAGVFAIALGGLIIQTSASSPPQSQDMTGIEIVLGSDRYQILGSTGDQALVLNPGCGSNPTVAYLEVDTSSVWVFGDPEAEPRELAIVPGATSIEATTSCDRIGLVGPAGKIELSLVD